MKLSIIIPCFNELNTVKKIIDNVIELSPYENEIIVIDDFSTDGSRKILSEIEKVKLSKLILNEKNYGKGYCIKKGIKEASGDIIIIFALKQGRFRFNPERLAMLFLFMMKITAFIAAWYFRR